MALDLFAKLYKKAKDTRKLTKLPSVSAKMGDVKISTKDVQVDDLDIDSPEGVAACLRESEEARFSKKKDFVNTSVAANFSTQGKFAATEYLAYEGIAPEEGAEREAA